MSIKISHVRAVIGFDITVEAKTTGDERLTYVGTKFDGRRIGHKVIRPPLSSYKRIFTQQGGWTPGLRHEIIVSTISNHGRDGAIQEWQDQ